MFRLFIWASIVLLAGVVAAGVRDGRPPGAWTVGTPAAGRVGIGRPTLHGGPVVLRPVRTTPCSICARVHICSVLGLYCNTVTNPGVLLQDGRNKILIDSQRAIFSYELSSNCLLTEAILLHPVRS